MADKPSVLTRERLAKGFTYRNYVRQIQNPETKAQFQRNDKEFTLAPRDRRSFARFKGRGLKVLALGEDWCPDVQRGLPIVARIAAAGGMDLRMCPRDQNKDIMQAYLNQGKFESIPVFVFFNRNMRELGRFIERPASATEFMNKVRAELAGKPEAEARAEMRRRTADHWDEFRQETVRQLKELLREA